MIRHLLLPCCLALLAGSLHAQDSTAADRARLQGEWRLVLASANGQTIETPPPGTRHVAGDTVTVTINDQLFLQAIFTLDPGMTPKHIDYDVIGGPMHGTQISGIYKLEGSRFTVCMGGPGASRPDDFVARDGEPGSCTVWEKQ